MTTSENTQRTFECDLNNIIKLYKTNQIDEFIKEMKNNVSHNIVSTFFNNDVTSQIDLKKVYTPLMKCYNIVKKGNYKSSVEDVVKENIRFVLADNLETVFDNALSEKKETKKQVKKEIERQILTDNSVSSRRISNA